jgi:trafficking protein particle complex subunit 5
VGLRLFELACFREKLVKRETKIVSMLSFIHSTIWKCLFGKSADSLEKSTEHDDEYMIIDNRALVNRFLSVPKDLGGRLNCAAYIAGIVHGVLDAAQFTPERVTAHSVFIEVNFELICCRKKIHDVVL